jgi:Protein of unknown function (DUF3373)
MKRFFILMMATLLLIPATSFAADPTIDDLQKQIAEIMEELDDLSDRLEKPERHAATDRISFYGDLRTKADSLHYQDVTFNPGVMVDFNHFFTEAAEGAGMIPGDPATDPTYQSLGVFQDFNMADPSASVITADSSALDKMFYNLMQSDPQAFTQLLTNFGNWAGAGMPPIPPGAFRMAGAPKTSDINNDIMYTTRMRLGMKAKIAQNMNFSGRLSMFKNWGDSTGSQVFDSWNAFTMDGTNGGNTTGDFLRVERAFFDWKDIGGSNFYLSIGRRPSTYGPPNEIRENELRGGTPTGHLVHFNFDGVTIGYKLSEITGIEGQVARFCYGQGFESEWGNGTMFNDDITANLEDTQLGGFNIDVYNDGQTFVQATLFRAQDVVDGFKGIIAFPTQYAELFAPTLYADMQKFPTFNFETRYTPTTVIGNINLAALGFTREEDNGFKWFGSVAWTQLDPNGKAGMFGGLGTDAVYEATLSADGSEVFMVPVRAENNDTQDGYGVYAGVQIPAPMGKVGFEYNYGSEYWTPFTQAQDDSLGSKLATRGHAAEAYYIFEINRNAFIKVGGIYYDYEYTGSGSPVGKPIKIDDIESGSAYSLMPVVDTAWDAYAQMTLRF